VSKKIGKSSPTCDYAAAFYNMLYKISEFCLTQHYPEMAKKKHDHDTRTMSETF